MLKNYWASFISLIYPHVCLSCSTALVKGEDVLCLRCFLDLPKTNYHLLTPNPLLEKLSSTYKIKNAFAFLKYDKKGVAQLLLHQLKYKGNLNAGIKLGEWFASDIRKTLRAANLDLIIPVPLHKSKQRMRGFNQTMLIAEGVKNQTGIIIAENILKRTKNIISQTKKRKVARWEDVENLYSINQDVELFDKNVLLIDDVITTGATIGVAAELIARSGVKNIYVACIATGA